MGLDENTDQGDTAQLAIFIRGVDATFTFGKEMLDLCHMKGTTTGRDIFEQVNSTLKVMNINKNKIISITTDGSPAMTGKYNEFIALFMNSVQHGIVTIIV